MVFESKATTRTTSRTSGSTTNTNSSLQPKSILKGSKSLSSLKNPNNGSTGNTNSYNNKDNKKKIGGLFKKVLIEWNLFCLKLKSISEEVFVTDEIVEDLFDESESDETLDRLSKASKGFTPVEEIFLKEHKVYKDLDKMYEAHQEKKQHQLRSKGANKERSVKLEDVIRHCTSASNTNYFKLEDDIDIDNENDEFNELNNDTINQIDFQDIDVCKIRNEFEAHYKKINEAYDDSTESSNTTLDPETSQNLKAPNIGETIWEFRRKRWLSTNLTGDDYKEKIQQRLDSLSISHVPKESYSKIYTNFVDKGKLLKEEKKLNLGDLIKIINAGWISEEKWQRAAKGLA